MKTIKSILVAGCTLVMAILTIIDASAFESIQSPDKSFSFLRQCVNITEKSTDISVPGVLILYGERSGPFFLDLSDFTRHTFPISPDAHFVQIGYQTSPDQRWFAYLESFVDKRGNWESLKLRLINSSGQRNMLSYWQANWQGINKWLDNEKLMLSMPKRTGSFIVLNPFTGKAYDFSPSIPNVDEYDYSVFYSKIFYQPQLSYVVYTDKLDANIKLRNIQSEKTIWQKAAKGSSSAFWSPTGEQFILPNNGALLLITLNGQETELLNLTEMDIPYQHQSDIGNLSWSPDGTKIAAWVGNPSQLVIIDLGAKQITDLCIEGEYYPSSPIWSPDSQFLAISANDKNRLFSSNAVIVPMGKNDAFKIESKKSLSPIGWMVKP